MKQIRNSILLCFFVLGWCAVTSNAHADSPGAKSGVSPSVLMLPKGPGSLGGIGENVRANLNMGLMSYPIRIILPKGRQEMTPSLNLVYSSSAGAGIVGIGWGLEGGGSIQRLTVRGLPQYNETDRFFGGTGELVHIPNTAFYRSRVEGGFIRYRWHQQAKTDQRGYWTAEHPSGEIRYYGADAKGTLALDAQVYGLEGTYAWKLRTRIDRNGNRIEYSYMRKGAQLYLSRIEWVFGKSGKPLYVAELSYQERPDPISDGKPGFDLQTTQRLSEIKIYSEGKRLRSYQLTFEDEKNKDKGGLSRLHQVTRYGRDPNKAHPVQFTMKYSESTFSPQNSMMVAMPTSVGQNFNARQSDFLDINGDGLPDVLNTANPKHQFHINELKVDATLKQANHDFPSAQVIENPKATNAELRNPSVQLLDINGDGYTDLVDAANKLIYINKGNGQWDNKSQSLQFFPVTGQDPDMRFFDYDGDKAIDIIRSDGTSTTYWVSDKKGNWKAVTTGAGIGASFSKDKVRLIDMNGDGLLDAVQIFGGKLRYRKYFGYGKWSDWINVEVPGLSQVDASFVDKAQFADINGDGLADMVAFLGTSIRYFVNQNGIKFAAGQELKAFKGIDIPDSTTSSIRIADINGNGSRDIIWVNSSGKITYLELFGLRPNLMTDISNGIGQRIEVTYGSSIYHRLRDEAAGNPWKSKLPMAFVVVNQIKTWAERDGQSQPKPRIQQISYHDGYYDGNEKKFRGFRRVETQLLGDDSIHTRRELHEYNVGEVDSYFHGKLKSKTVTDDKGKIYFHSTLEWKDCGVPAGAAPELDPPVRFICMAAHEKRVQEGNTDQSAWRTLRNEVLYDAYGNVTLESILGLKDKEGDEKYKRVTYITPSAPTSTDATWILRAPQKREICSSLKGPCAEIRYYYDGEPFQGLPLGQIKKGDLTRSEVRVLAGKDTFHPAIRQRYDAFGNMLEKLSPGNERITVEYDQEYSRFTTKETLYPQPGVSFSSTTSWDYGLSAVIRSTNFNGHRSYYGYDEFGRISSIAQPGDTPDKPSVRYVYNLGAPLSTITTQKRSKVDGPWDRTSVQCFDGLGRKLSVAIQLDDTKYVIFSHKEHNALGLTAKLWNAYTSSTPCAFTAPQETKVTTREYDGLQRLIKQTNPDGTFKTSVYQILKNIAFDEEDNRKDSPHYNTPVTTLLDGLGRVIAEQKSDRPGNTITTRYEYNNHTLKDRDLLKTIIFPDGSQKQHVYDLQGNILTLIDPDRSTISFVYNMNNLLEKKTDARGITTLYTYDGAKRLTSIQEAGKDNTRISFYYDQPSPALSNATNLKMRLARVVYPGGEDAFSYNTRGLQSHRRRMLLGVAFDVLSNYNHNEELTSTTLPDGRIIEYTRDKLGRITSIPGKIKEVKYLDSGERAGWIGANDVATSYTYNDRRWLTKIDVAGNAGFSLAYQHDGNGNIRSINATHGGQAFQHTYEYDDLYRLTRASLEDGKEVLTYKQDNLDNLIEKNSNLGDQSPAHIGTFGYDKTKIHAATKAGKLALKYDNAGYMTDKGSWAFQWDFMGRRTHTLQDGEVVGRDWYDASRSRVLKQEKGLHTIYVNNQFHIRDGMATAYIFLGRDRVVAWRSPALLAKIYDDLAPASGKDALQAKPDGKITVADAWLYHASRTKALNIPTKKRPIDVDLTQDMLNIHLQRLFHKDEPQTHYWHVDHLGSIRAVSDQKGSFVARKHYSPYGTIRHQEGLAFSHGLMGTERDQLTGLNYFYARFMDADIGKWLSPDPAFEQIRSRADEFNSYGSVKNNPIRYRDLDGFSASDTTEAPLDTELKAFGIESEIKRSVASDIAGSAAASIAGMILIYKLSVAAGKANTSGFKHANAKARSASTIVILATTATIAFSTAKALRNNNASALNNLSFASSMVGIVATATSFAFAYKDNQSGKVTMTSKEARSHAIGSAIAITGILAATIIRESGGPDIAATVLTAVATAGKIVATVASSRATSRAKKRFKAKKSRRMSRRMSKSRR